MPTDIACVILVYLDLARHYQRIIKLTRKARSPERFSVFILWERPISETVCLTGKVPCLCDVPQPMILVTTTKIQSFQ